MNTNPAIEVLIKERDVLTVKIEESANTLRDLKERQKAIDTAIKTLEVPVEDRPTVEAVNSSDEVSLTDLVYECVRSKSGITPKDIVARISEQGREAKPTSISSMLNRLRIKGRLRRQKGRWYLSTPKTTPILPKERHPEKEFDGVKED